MFLFVACFLISSHFSLLNHNSEFFLCVLVAKRETFTYFVVCLNGCCKFFCFHYISRYLNYGSPNFLCFCRIEYIGNVVEKRTKEVSNFLEMLRSASPNGPKTLKNPSYNEWKVIL